LLPESLVGIVVILFLEAGPFALKDVELFFGGAQFGVGVREARPPVFFRILLLGFALLSSGFL
jgi:hypothetical protein